MFKRYIKVCGTSRERGYQIGQQLKNEIMTNYLNEKEYYRAQEAFDYEVWENMAKRYVPMMEKWTPEVLEEMYGMAEGSDIEFLRILSLTTAYEKSAGRNLVSDKCTSFFVTGKASKDGLTIAAQTNDESLLEWRNELDVVIHHKTENGTEMLIYTHPGIPAYMGISNHGLVILWTYIDNGKTCDGVPTTAIIRHVLSLSNIDEAISFLQAVPHDIPNQYGLADANGNLVCAECYPNKVYIVREESSFVHTNHNVYAKQEPECTASETTYDRYATMKGLIEKNWGQIDANMAMEFLRSHEKGSNSICVHPSPEHPWKKTLAAMVYELDKGVMHIAFGNPCEAAYHTFKFDRYDI